VRESVAAGPRLLTRGARHLRIEFLDERAEAVTMPGVHAVLTHADVPGVKYYGLEFADQPVLAIDRVLYYGEPVALVADAIKDCTRRGDVVLDTFSGSGTTVMAAERVGRYARALEIEPRFVDVTIRRWQAFTRRDAHAESGLSFEEIAAATPPSGQAPALSENQ